MELSAPILKKYRLPNIGIRFIDREKEISSILALEDFQTHAIIGPRGCGKTNLMHVISYLLKEKGDTQVTYIGYMRRGLNLYTQIYSTNSGISKDIAKWSKKYFRVVDRFSYPAKGLELLGFIDPYAPLRISTKIKFIFKKRLKLKHIIIVDGLDEVLSDQNTIKVVNKLGQELRGKLSESIKKAGGTIKILAVFSRNILGLPKMELNVLWNFNKSTYEKFLSEVSCPLDFSELWTLCGGNLGLTVELLNLKWNLEAFIEQNLEYVKRAIEKYSLNRRRSLADILSELKEAEEVDILAEKDLWKILEQHYFTISIPEGRRLSEIPKEKWIGKKAAWQAPIYMYCFKAILSKGVKASTEDVVKLFK